jgi:hypothetical protein
MMIQIGHRESHDIDIFLDDPQLLGFIDPSKSQLSFNMVQRAVDHRPPGERSPGSSWRAL